MSMERLVVIDDNPSDAQLIHRLLSREGYEVSYAHSGEAGLAMLAESPADCVLVDFRMPGMDGYEVCRRIKAEGKLQNIPVIMLTGADSAQNLVAGLDAGADDFVTKSAEMEVLLARVRAALRVKASQDRIVEQAAELRRLNERFNKDLQFAKRVQEALLPERHFSTARTEIRSAYIPSETLSGDFYDYFVERGNLYLFLADVSGHGLPSAILVSLLKSFLHSEAADAQSLAGFMTRLNSFMLGATLPSQYATAQLLRIEEERMRLSFANAAHPPFVLLQQGREKAEIREVPGNMLGVLPVVSFEEHQMQLQPGDLLFAYTDGLTDRRAASGEFFDIETVVEILRSMRDADLGEIHDRILAEVSRFEGTEEYNDDIAFVLARFRD
jgi:serine phosphatase RsbU (regulator of sigma subunit)